MNRSILAGWALVALLFGVLGARAAEDSPSVTKLMTSDIVVEPNGTSTMTVHVELLATNEATARTIGQTSIPFNESSQDLEIVEAYTQKTDGQKLTVSPSAIFTQQPQGSPLLVAINDLRQKVVVFPSVGPGDTVVYTARWRTRQPQIPGHFTYNAVFQRGVAYNEVRGTITVPKSLALQTESHDIELRKEETPDKTSYHWRYSAPASSTVDLIPVSPLDQMPRLFFSSLKDQQELGRVYASLIAPMAAVTPKIQALANQLTAGLSDRRQQAQNIYEWVSKNVRYVAVDIGNGGIIPHSADTTLTNGYGDCKDQAILFAALLKAVGIESEAVLINLGNAYTTPQVATIVPFNHLIIWIPEFGMYADTTTGVAPFGVLPFQEYGKPVVHATATGQVVRRTPVVPVGVATMSLKTTARLDRSGNVTGDSTVTAAGPFALTLRAVGLAAQAAGPARFASAYFETQGLKGTGTIDVASPSDLAPSYTLTSHFEYADGRLVSGRGFGLVRGLSLSPMTGDVLMGSLLAATQDEGEATACYSGHTVEELVLEFPPGAAQGVPPESRIKTANLEFTARWTASGNIVTVRREFTSTIDQPLCTGEVRRETARALTQIRDLVERSGISYNAPQVVAQSNDPVLEDALNAALKGDQNAVASLQPRAQSQSRVTPQARALGLFRSADESAKKGDNEHAIEDYTKALELRPDYREALVNRGTAYAATRKFEEAVKDFSAAVRLGPGDIALRNRRATAYQALGKFDEAADDYGVVIRANPDNVRAYVNRAQAYSRAGLYERSIADCETALRLDRETAECHRSRGFALFVLAKTEEAIASFTTAIEMQPDAAPTHYQRGLANLAAGHFENAISDFDSSIRLGDNDANALFARGIAREKRGNQADANIDFVQANRTNPRVALQLALLGIARDRFAQTLNVSEVCSAAAARSEDLRATIYCGRVVSDPNASTHDKALAHFAFGSMHQRQGHYPEALKSLEQAVSLDPSSAEAHIEKGNALRLQDEPDQAIQSYEEAIKLAPFSAAAFHNRGLARQAKGQIDAALTDYSQAITLNPSYDAAFLQRASVYLERMQFDSALVDYDRAIRLNANVGAAFKGRCYALGAAGRLNQAMGDCERSLELDPDDAGAYDARALVHLRQREYPAAIDDYDAALAVDPDRADSLYGRGVAKLRSGNAMAGNADIAEAVKIDPNIAATMTRFGVSHLDDLRPARSGNLPNRRRAP